MKYEFLLVKIGEAKYKTPCGKYTIDYTNSSYYDDIHWVARGPTLITIYAETLSDLAERLAENNPYMITKLYKILFGVK